MKRLRTLVVAVACLGLTSCCLFEKGTISKAALRDTLLPVLERHDGYVNTDPKVTELELRTYLRTSELLRRAVK